MHLEVQSVIILLITLHMFFVSQRDTIVKPYMVVLGLYMVAVERQTQNRARALAEGMRAAESQAGGAADGDASV